MSIERRFDVPFVGALALREKQIQQNYRPIIGVHKWFARRPGTLFRGLLLAERGEGPVANRFYEANELAGVLVADPFMGGGTPLIEANRLSCDVVGWDINPMAWWIVRQEIEHLDLEAYGRAARDLIDGLGQEVGELYRTACTLCGSREAHVKYFLWVKTLDCRACEHKIDLFPGYLVAESKRHPKNVLLCAGCDSLQEVDDRRKPGDCGRCGRPLATKGPAGRASCRCPSCNAANDYPRGDGPPRHRMFALEYHCPRCRPGHAGRFFKTPDEHDLARFEDAKRRCLELQVEFVPDDEVPPGDETDRVHRWGYLRYREMFNERQLLGLELSCRRIAAIGDERVRNALSTNLSDLLRYQNLLCRYDTMALKSLDIFSVHGFPVGLVVCESNLLGIQKRGGGNVGSGGWSNIVAKYTRAKVYCDAPFEVRQWGARKSIVPIRGEWIGEIRNGSGPPKRRKVELHSQSATEAELAAGSLDMVITDPPYFGNVQYAELMDFCYVWLRRLVRPRPPAFEAQSTRSPDELTGNVTLSRGLEHFTEGLANVFTRMARALKSGAPMAFTYHHNRLDAYYPVAVAILDAGLTCTASLPCPAEMAGSIHISGTGSSVVDTVFVCRTTGSIARRYTLDSLEAITELVRSDLADLAQAGLQANRGDIRCIVHGHLIRVATWRLRAKWSPHAAASAKLAAVAAEIARLTGGADADAVAAHELAVAPFAHAEIVGERASEYGLESDEIPF